MLFLERILQPTKEMSWWEEEFFFAALMFVHVQMKSFDFF